VRRLAVVALVIAAAGCKTVAHGDYWEDDIEAKLKEQGKNARVECPARIPLGVVEDNHFECVIVWQQGRTPVTVQLDDKGGWKIE
jgi:hypothetical protein